MILRNKVLKAYLKKMLAFAVLLTLYSVAIDSGYIATQ